MKLFSLLLCFSLIATPLCQAKFTQGASLHHPCNKFSEKGDKAAVKDAESYVKTELANKKKALSILKNVNDAKSALKAGNDIQKFFKPSKSALAKAKKLEKGAMILASQKFEDQMDKLDIQIQEQYYRIDALGIKSPEFEAAFEAIDGMLDYE